MKNFFKKIFYLIFSDDEVGGRSGGNQYDLSGNNNVNIARLQAKDEDGVTVELINKVVGAIKTAPATLFPGDDQENDVKKIERRGNFYSISSAGTYVIKNGAGHLNFIKVVGGTMAQVSVYDNVTETGTAIIASSPVVTPVQGQELVGEGEFNTGLCVRTYGATVLLISYR